MSEIVDHRDAKNGFWRHEPPKPSNCAHCGAVTVWVWADLTYFCDPDCRPCIKLYGPRGKRELRIIEALMTEATDE
jgi:hypothetical protein